MKSEPTYDEHKARRSPNYKRNNPSSRASLGKTTIQIFNAKLVNENDILSFDKLVKTFCSASRCAFKRFMSISFDSLEKSVKTPTTEYDGKTFSNTYWTIPPQGMTEKMWIEMRRDAYAKKRINGLKKANSFYRKDKAMGSPIKGAEESVAEWVRENDFNLDSVLIHEATLNGLRSYRTFNKKKSKWKTSKDAPSFGEIELRSKRKLTKGEFDITRNSSIVVSGNAKNGNSKFRFNSEDMTMDFIFNRKRIRFSLNSHRFSKKGLKRFESIVNAMNSGKLPVTVTLTRIGNGKFNVSLSYCPIELEQANKTYGNRNPNRIACIYFTDEAICHTIVDKSADKILDSKIYYADSISGYAKAKNTIQLLEFNEDFKKAASAKKRIANRLSHEVKNVLNKMFKKNESYNVGKVVVERPSSKTKRNFNCGFIELDKNKIGKTNANCFMSASRLVSLVKSQCARSGMKFSKSNGAFVQAIAVLKTNSSSSIKGALKNACLELISRNELISRDSDVRNCTKNSYDHLTDLAEAVCGNPSMLDWIAHLLHNKRRRQARCELRKMINDRIVERAIRLCHDRSRIGQVEGCANTTSISGGLLV